MPGAPDGRTRLLGIVGDPLDHSRSPELHSTVLRKLERNLLYLPVPVSADRLRAFLRLAPELGFIGLNVTTPYKEQVARWVEPGDEETRRTRMVNTVFWRSGVACGIGTDGAGILQWARSARTAGPLGVLGFGPTARSLIHRSWLEGPPVAVVLTRRPPRARAALARWRRETGERKEVTRGGLPLVSGWPEMTAAGGSRDLTGVRTWISSLPPRVSIPDAFWAAVDPRSVFLDLNYGEGRTDLAERARARGLRAADGLGPLLEQAALSLSLWLGESVPVELFRRAAGATTTRLRPR